MVTIQRHAISHGSEISDLKRKNEGASRRIAQLEQEYAQLMANNQSLSSSTVSLSDYKKLGQHRTIAKRVKI